MKKFLLPVFAVAAAFCFYIATAPRVSAEAAELTSKDIVLAVTEKINAGSEGTLCTEGIAEFNLQYGTKESPLNFKLVKSENGLGSEETYNALGYTSAHINDNLIRISKDFGLIFTFSFSENVKFAIDNPEANADSLSNKATAETYVSDGRYDVLLKSADFPSAENTTKISAGEIAQEIHLKAGDKLTFVLKTDSVGRSFSKFLPVFSYDASAYKEDLRFDFSAYGKFRDRAEKIGEELYEYYFSLDTSKYSADNQLVIINAIENAKEELKTIEFGTDLEAYKAKVLETVKNVPTIEEEAAQVEEIKTAKTAALKEFYLALSREGFSILAKKELKKIYESGAENIGKATTAGGANRAYNEAVAEMNEVGKGSDAWLYCTIAGAVLLIAAAVTIPIVIRKKKRRKENDET